MMFGWQRWRLQCLRKYYVLKGDAAIMAPLTACWQPFDPARFLAVDCEMSALDVKAGELLSMGWVPIDQGVIALSQAQHVLVRPQASVGQSAIFHELKDSDLAVGLDADDALRQLLLAAAGRTLVYHHAALDLAYLNQLCRSVFGAPLLMPYQDTLEIEQQRLKNAQQYLQPDQLRLPACRQRYGLPDYPLHNALSDALATAELFLAQRPL